MSQTVNINSYGSNNALGDSELRVLAPAGIDVLVLENSAAALPGSFAVLGVLGSDTAEMVSIFAPVNGVSVKLNGPTVLPHTFGEPLTYLFGDQICIYAAPNIDGNAPPDDTFELIGTQAIDVTKALTPFTDPLGDGDRWYKATFRSSVTSGESSLAAATARRGDRNQNYCSLAQIRQEAGFKNAPYITDELIDEKRQVAQAEVVSTIRSVYQFPLPQPVNPNIMNATMQIAAGLLMSSQYGTMNPSLAKEGDAKVAEGRATLSLIATKVLVLDDANFNDASIPDGPNSPSFYPATNNGVRPAYGTGGPNVSDRRMFNIGDRY
jgi:hypothetical protein